MTEAAAFGKGFIASEMIKVKIKPRPLDIGPVGIGVVESGDGGNEDT
jgi:hypothetical protein